VSGIAEEGVRSKHREAIKNSLDEVTRMMLSMPRITSGQVGLIVEAYIINKLLEERRSFSIPLKLDDPAEASALVETIPIAIYDSVLIQARCLFQLRAEWNLAEHDYLLYQRDERFPGFDFFIWSKTRQMLLAFQCTVIKENLVSKMNRNMESFASVVHPFQEAFKKKGIDNLEFVPIALVPSWTEATSRGKNKDFFRVNIQDLQDIIPLAGQLDQNTRGKIEEAEQEVGPMEKVKVASRPFYFTPKKANLTTSVEQQATVSARQAMGTSEKVRHTTKRARRK